MVLTVVMATLLALVASLALAARRTQHRLESQLEIMRNSARIEEHTHLRTAQAFADDLELEILRVDRTGRPACLVVLSLHEQPHDARADAQRAALADVLRSVVRAVDVGYRIGEDEFAVILPDTRARGALVAAGRLERAALDAGIEMLSGGIAEAGPGIDRHQLFRNAYCAMLAAGQGGHSSVLAYSPELERGTAGSELAGFSEIAPVPGLRPSQR